MKKVLEVIGALTLGSALVGGGILYGSALGILAATDRKTAEGTFYGRVLVGVIDKRKFKKPYICYANSAQIREAEKKVNEKFKDRDSVSIDEIAKEVHKELGLDRTDKWPFFSMTEEEQR